MENLEAEQPQVPEVQQQKIVIVIDANVIIKQIRLRDILKTQDDQEFNSKYEVHTMEDVITEIRDETVHSFPN